MADGARSCWPLLALVASFPAAALEVQLEAEVSADLSQICGTVRADGPVTWVDPLASLPSAPDDRSALRTWPGAPDDGSLTLSPLPDGGLQFCFDAPRRFGAQGVTGAGLAVAGGFHPLPQVDGQWRPVDWRARVHLPPEAIGALNGRLGSDLLTFEGEAERLSLVVPRRPRVHRWSTPQGELVVLSHRAPLRRWQPELTRAAGALGDLSPALVVEIADRRRLTRPTAGMLLLSDRAYRLTPGLERYHRLAVTEGLLAASLPLQDPLARSLAAAGLVQAPKAEWKGESAGRLLRRLRWVPVVDRLLSSATMPFYGEILERTHPTDPIADDLAERLAPLTHGRVVAAQLDDTFGPGTAFRVATALAEGRSLDDASLAGGVPPGWIDRWRRPYPVQDYRLEVETSRVRVTREAPADAPPETVVLRIDGQDLPLTFDEGPGALAWPLPEGARSVVLDPDDHLLQTRRVGDAWPPRWQWTANAGITSINLRRVQIEAGGALTLRRQGDTHNLTSAFLETDRINLATLGLSYLRKVGPLQDGWRRPHRFTVGASSALLSPSFAELDGHYLALDGTAGWTWDTRVSNEFPLRGRQLAVGGAIGGLPGTDLTWSSASARARGVASPHPRWAAAGQLVAARAWSELPHRRLPVGGPQALISLPALPACTEPEPGRCATLLDQRVTAALELRAVPLRNVSVPLGLAWGSELQIAAGLEGLLGSNPEGPVWASGLTVGLSGVADVLGAEPMMAGITLGWPLVGAGIPELAPGGWPELFLRWEQRF